jgi:hypothetical protein
LANLGFKKVILRRSPEVVDAGECEVGSVEGEDGVAGLGLQVERRPGLGQQQEAEVRQGAHYQARLHT